MATRKLTKRAVDGLQATPGGDYFVWDTELKGFGVRVSAKGKKVFVLKYRPIGRRESRRVTLGVVGPLSVVEARKQARRLIADVVNGGDPSRERKASKLIPTVRQLGEAYLTDVKARLKLRTATDYEAIWENNIDPTLGSNRVADVTPADVARVHRALSKTPYQANRVLAVIGAFFTFAAREGHRARHDNPAHYIKFFPEKARERFLSPAEFKKLGDALATAERLGLPPAPQHRRKPKSEQSAKHRPKRADVPKPADPMTLAAIRLIALTGCREGEILSLRWDAVDLERGYLRLADTKTGRSVRPLGAPAAELLTRLPRQAGSPYVFPGVKRGSHLQEIKRVWYAIRHAAELDDVRMHDLRHSFASVSAIEGTSLLIIRSLLGHADIKTTQKYAHLGDDPVKAAADRTAQTVNAWLNGQTTEVTPLASRAAS
jgi:integrase